MLIPYLPVQVQGHYCLINGLLCNYCRFQTAANIGGTVEPYVLPAGLLEGKPNAAATFAVPIDLTDPLQVESAVNKIMASPLWDAYKKWVPDGFFCKRLKVLLKPAAN